MSLSESREVINFANSLGLRKAGNSGQYSYVKGIEKDDIENMLEAYKTNQPLDENLRQKYAILLLHRYNENIMTGRIGLSKKGQYDPVNRRILEAITQILRVDRIINVEQLRDIMPAYNSIFSEYTNGQVANNGQKPSREPTTIFEQRRSARVALSPPISYSPRQPRRQTQSIQPIQSIQPTQPTQTILPRQPIQQLTQPRQPRQPRQPAQPIQQQTQSTESNTIISQERVIPNSSQQDSTRTSQARIIQIPARQAANLPLLPQSPQSNSSIATNTSNTSPQPRR